MSDIQPFRALRPRPELAAEVAAPPYDVVSLAEARALAAGKPHSFLRVSRAELELEDSTNPYDSRVYAHGAENLRRLRSEGVLVREPSPVLGVYRQRAGSHVQTGIVALASVAEYDADRIKKHELTKPDKETDRVRLIEAHDSQSGPVFLAYRPVARLAAWLERVTAQAPEIELTAEDGVVHTTWIVRDAAQIAEAVAAFGDVPALYIADGHHRSAAASRVYAARRAEKRLEGGEGGFLSVLFSADALRILPYNRLVADLAGRTPATFLEALTGPFHIQETADPGSPPANGFDVYVGGQWYRARPRAGIVPVGNPVGALSVSVLTDQVIAPLLGIADQRTDKRIEFVGGIRGVADLQARVDSGRWAVAFWLDPTGLDALMAVADQGQIMPPKSTWFEPKLRDGLFIHEFGP